MSKSEIRAQFFFDQEHDAMTYQDIIKQPNGSIRLNPAADVLSVWEKCQIIQNQYGSIVLLDEWKDFPEIEDYLDPQKTDKIVDNFFHENESVFQRNNIFPKNIIIRFKGKRMPFGEQFYVYCKRMMEPALKEFLHLQEERKGLSAEIRAIFDNFPEKISWCYKVTSRTDLAFMEDDPEHSCVNLDFHWDEVEDAVIARIFNGTFDWCVAYMKKEARYNGKVIFYESES